MTLWHLPLNSLQLSIIKHCDDVRENPGKHFELDDRLPKQFPFAELKPLLNRDFVHALRAAYPDLFIWFFVSAEPLVIDLKDIWEDRSHPRLYTVRYYVRKLPASRIGRHSFRRISLDALRKQRAS